MKRAILLTGFNNWGKTTHISNLFQRKRFSMGAAYAIPGVNGQFTVESHSNDDFGEINFVEAIKKKIAQSPPNAQDLFCAFCPTRENHNDSRRILHAVPFSTFDQIHLLLLKFKWDFHAELRIPDIRRYLSPLTNVQIFEVDADAGQTTDALRCQARENQMLAYLKHLYP